MLNSLIKKILGTDPRISALRDVCETNRKDFASLDYLNPHDEQKLIALINQFAFDPTDKKTAQAAIALHKQIEDENFIKNRLAQVAYPTLAFRKLERTKPVLKEAIQGVTDALLVQIREARQRHEQHALELDLSPGESPLVTQLENNLKLAEAHSRRVDAATVNDIDGLVQFALGG